MLSSFSNLYLVGFLTSVIEATRVWFVDSRLEQPFVSDLKMN